MGEANRRGSPAIRTEQAMAALRARFAATVTCNHCGAELADIVPMAVRGIPGLRLAAMAHCGACEHGTPEAQALFQEYLAADNLAPASALYISSIGGPFRSIFRPPGTPYKSRAGQAAYLA